MIVIGRDAKGKFHWRVGSPVEWTQGEQIFTSEVAAADALGFALRQGFPREYCAALTEAILDSLLDTAK